MSHEARGCISCRGEMLSGLWGRKEQPPTGASLAALGPPAPTAMMKRALQFTTVPGRPYWASHQALGRHFSLLVGATGESQVGTMAGATSGTHTFSRPDV